ncbi:MAG: CoB--CoM heterodisulfide reductase subunit C [Candidatus Hermodarchaeota archaeon]
MLDYEPNIITDFRNELMDSLKEAGYPEADACIQCGTCSGGCPAGTRTALRVRTVMRKIQLGIDDVLSDNDIWYCSTCYTCLERCPRKLPITDMIIYLRNLAVQKGFMHKNHLDLSKKLLFTGHGVPIDSEKWKDLREYYGLKRIPPTVHSHKKDLDEVKKLLISSKFNKLVNVEVEELKIPPEIKLSKGEETIVNYVIDEKKLKTSEMQE